MVFRTRRFRVNVTAEHIRNGRRLECDECPIALALNDLGLGRWMVSPLYMWNTRGFEVVTPAAATAFVLACNHGEPLAPFAFEIEIARHLLPVAREEANRAEEVWATLGR